MFGAELDGLEVGPAEAISGCDGDGIDILSTWIFASAARASGSPDITRWAVSCDMLETDRWGLFLTTLEPLENEEAS
jgi:hypothetical protein